MNLPIGGPTLNPSPSGGSAHFDGAITVALLPRSQAAAALPAPLTLANVPSGIAGHEHPLIVTFGELRHGGMHWFGKDLSLGFRYREAALLVPFTQHPQHPEPHVFVLDMLVEHSGAMLIGNTVYGYRKQLTRIETDGACYAAHSARGQVFAGTGSLAGHWSSASARRDTLQWLESTLSLPILGRHDSGAYIRSSFDWDFGGALVCDLAAEMEWRTSADLLRLRSGSLCSLAVRGLIWRTGWPQLLSASALGQEATSPR